MNTNSYNEAPDFITGDQESIAECPCCDEGELVIGEGADIYYDDFYSSWSCSCCNFSASVSGKIRKYQKLVDEDEDIWEDCKPSEEDDASYSISTAYFKGISSDDIDGKREVVYGMEPPYEQEDVYRAVIDNFSYSDNREDAEEELNTEEDEDEYLEDTIKRLEKELEEKIEECKQIYRLQQYEDGTFGYLDIDGDEYQNYRTGAKVIYMQGKNEDREDFIAKNHIEFTTNQYGSNLKLDIKINESHDHWVIREDIVENYKYGLDKLINDKVEYVRAAVAKQGYGLDKLINDSDYHVRWSVAKQGYGLDILINDKDYDVRAAVAEQGYGLDKLVNDKEYQVRRAVAKQGYGLNILINDEDNYVRNAVNEYLKDHNLTLDDIK